jgi:leucyl aminopeptidase
MSGATIEIVNTDAEGRLLLCDALTLAQEQWTPRAVVDIATLTGACAVALGRSAGGLFCDDAELRERIYALGQRTGDTVWPLPLWKSALKNIRSNVADIANSGTREGGAIQAAMFLKHFVADTTPWAHLDIAGAASAREKQPLRDEGATGFGLRILYHLAKDGICPNA